jgi:hypothetical protein
VACEKEVDGVQKNQGEMAGGSLQTRTLIALRSTVLYVFWYVWFDSTIMAVDPPIGAQLTQPLSSTWLCTACVLFTWRLRRVRNDPITRVAPSHEE